MGIGRLLDISVRTMATYQNALDVTSNNISNAGNSEYTRQKVLLSTEVTQGGIGMGVKLQDVQRIKNNLVDSQIRKYQSSLSDSSLRSEILQQVESVIAEPSDTGLSFYINDFFNSWSELSSNPNSPQLRSQIVQKGQRMSDRFSEVFEGFDSVQTLLQKEATTTAGEINNSLKLINELNQKIFETESRGMNASDLKDKRDSQIDNLSSLVNINVHQNKQGAAIITIGGVHGADLNVANSFEIDFIDGQMKLVSQTDSTATVQLSGGDMYAIADLYSNKLPSYKDQLGQLAQVIVNKVNDTHKTGFTLAQNGISKTNIPFFGEMTPDGTVVNSFVSGKMRINTSIFNDPRNIAVSSSGANDGNGDIAVALANLNEATIGELNGRTILDSYSGILSDFGMEKSKSDSTIESNELIIHQLTTQKAAYSGVSLDEEMANVIKFQRSYEASAKLVRVADEMMQVVLNMV
ncbi:MAG: flagellar hook-associated protein FlgK [Melioribacteraceae bacterium]|nr:flagellar hook-associated protein FlgK [Melioribacteraceae bacterium]